MSSLSHRFVVLFFFSLAIAATLSLFQFYEFVAADNTTSTLQTGWSLVSFSFENMSGYTTTSTSTSTTTSTSTSSTSTTSTTPTWHDALRVDTVNGSRPALAYSPAGKLWVFYNKDEGGDDEPLVVRIRNGSGSNFTDEVEIESVQEVRKPSATFISEDEVWVSAESWIAVWAYETNDSGSDWDRVEGFSASNYLPVYAGSAMTIDEDDFHLFYTYSNTGVWTAEYLYRGYRINGTWDDSGTYIGHPSDDVVGAFESGDEICVAAGRLFRSDDDGDSFTQINNDLGIPDVLNSITGADQGDDGIIYVIRTYSYGAGPIDQHLRIHNSSDYGATWSVLATFDDEDYFYLPKIAVSGDTIGALWGRRDLDDLINLSARFSFDGGATWTEEETVVSAPEGFTLGRNYFEEFKIDSHNNTFTIIYEHANGSTPEGVYIKEYY
ncbi:hypothetical protein ACFLRC_02005 [Candidatus Altiarchaeota archaeon]